VANPVELMRFRGSLATQVSRLAGCKRGEAIAEAGRSLLEVYREARPPEERAQLVIPERRGPASRAPGRLALRAAGVTAASSAGPPP